MEETRPGLLAILFYDLLGQWKKQDLGYWLFCSMTCVGNGRNKTWVIGYSVL